MPTNAPIRVVDFSTHFSGPMASRELVNLGADVIKVERPVHGDGNRAMGASVAGASGVHHVLNAGTRSIVIDNRGPAWQTTVDALVASADAVIVGARPADAEARGLGFERLARFKPGLVYCAITGYGDGGPWADRPAHGLQPDLMAGAVPVDHSGDAPTIPDAYKVQGTLLAGLWASIGILGGLLRRNADGRAQYVSVSMWEAALAWMWREGVNELNGLPQRPGFQALGSRYRLYDGSDGVAVLVCPIERKFWVRFVDIVGLPASWRDIGSWENGADNGLGRDEEVTAIAERIATRTAAEWDDVLAAAGIPCALVQTVGEAYASAQAQARGSVHSATTAEGTIVQVPVPPISVLAVAPGDDTSAPTLAERHRIRGVGRAPAPTLGQHTNEILQELGLGPVPPEETATN